MGLDRIRASPIPSSQRRQQQRRLTDGLTLLPKKTLKENNAWGDKAEEFLGEGIMRVGFQNMNGIKYTADGTNFDVVFHMIKRWHVNFMGMAEPNLEWRRLNVMTTMHQAS